MSAPIGPHATHPRKPPIHFADDMSLLFVVRPCARKYRSTAAGLTFWRFLFFRPNLKSPIATSSGECPLRP